MAPPRRLRDAALLTTLAASCAASAGCAHALCDEQPEGWHAVTTSHFVIHTNARGPRYTYLADRLERMYAAFGQSPFFGELDAGAVDVVLYDDYTEFVDQFGYNRASISVHRGGAAGRTAGVMFVGIDTPETEMAHALAHHLADQPAHPLPPWFEEGLALYAETVVVLEGIVRFGLPTEKVSEVHMGRTVTLPELFDATWADFDGDFRGRYASTAEELVRILASGDGRDLPPVYERFWAAVHAGAGSADALAAAWPSSTVQEVENALDAYVRKQQAPRFVGYRSVGSRRMKLEASEDDAASLRGLCAVCKSLDDKQREGWPDWIPPAAAAPGSAPAPAPASTPAPGASGPAAPP